MSRELREFIQREVLFAEEAYTLLGITKGRLSQLVADGKLRPVKIHGRQMIFLRSDVLARAAEQDRLRRRYGYKPAN